MRYAIWAVSDDANADRCAESVASVRRHVTDVTTILLSPTASRPGFDWHIRTQAPIEPWQWYYYRTDWYIKALGRLQMDSRVLFLDSDIYIVEPIEDVFALLDKFDLVGAHNCRRRVWQTPRPVPEAFCEVNCGFLACTATARTRALFAHWYEVLLSYNALRGEPNDQPAFRQALWEWDGRLYVMPPEYNIQWRQGGFASGRVKVLHGNSDNYEASAAWLNTGEEMRAWTKQQAI